ncbi:MAG: hypothetical protein HY706_12670 [Candidatus Hydrogenedentes bacterium]|nr:hypothetical protein [Candidatus Hydrogenedentota bacterium]
MLSRSIVLALVAGLVSGCLHQAPATRVFTPEWADSVQRHEKESPAGELVLMGRKAPVRTSIKLDEEGKAKLSIGGKSGLKTDIGVHSGEPSVKVKYEWKW